MSVDADFGSGDAVAVVDAKLRIAGWNASAEALTWTPATAAVGRHCWEVLHARSDDESIDQTGAGCEPGCRLALRALQSGDVAGRPMLIATGTGTRRVWMTTLTALVDGHRFIVHVFADGAPPRRSAGVARLTPREREVLSMLGEGLEASAVAARLGISVTTVRTHIRHILATLGVRSQLAAVTSTFGSAQPSSYDSNPQD